jgi:hypothetical protein
MSERLEKSGSASSHRPQSGTPFPLVPRRGVSIGAETVINPERRLPSAEGDRDPPSTASSGLFAALFPRADAVSDGSDSSPVGIELGHFRIEERIRTGGMGA